MKRIFYTFVLLAFAICINGQVKFAFGGGIDNASTKSSVERNISKLLTEINNAQRANRTLILTGINMTQTAKDGLKSLWNNLHFKCEWKSNVQNCLRDVTGYEVRGIPVQVIPLDDTYKGTLHKELTISFSRSGVINGVRMSLDNHAYQDLMRGGTTVSDISQRREILKFVEDFRSYYDEKNLNAIENIFSENALIITGRVVQSIGNSHMEINDPRKKVIYTKQNKVQYISNLGKVFKNNRYINVNFSDIQLMRHPAKANFYGVRLRQKWNSQKYNGELYNDDGYLFLFWDFTDPEKPKIHVRSWTQYNPTLTEDDMLSPIDFEF